jgi:hypothetical protein
MRDKRVGHLLAVAVCATNREISITEVALQAASQGLLPCDFDDENGTDALVAIALGLFRRKLNGPAPREPVGWRGAVEAALRLVHKGAWTQRQRRGDDWRAQVRAKQFNSAAARRRAG